MSHDNASSVSEQIDLNMLLEEGNKYYQKKDYEKALGYFEKALQIDINNVQAYIGKGNCLRQQESYQSAIKVYQHVLSLSPQQIAAYNGICYTYIESKEYGEALSYNTKAISLEKENASVYNCKGQILKYQKEYKKALEAFTMAIKLAGIEDNLAGYYYNKSIVLAELGRIEEATDACNISTLLAPGNTKYCQELWRLSQCNSPLQKNPLAQRYTENRALFCIDDAKIVYKHGQCEVALTLLAKAQYIDPGQLSAYTEKGNIYLALQEYKEAFQAFDEVLFVCPNDILALLGKARALHSLKDYDQAIETYNRALQIDSNLVEAIAGKGHSYFGIISIFQGRVARRGLGDGWSERQTQGP